MLMEISRESIFSSALRSFCKMFFSVIGILIAIFVFSCIYSIFSGVSLIEEKTTMHILPDAAGNRDAAAFTSPVILQINVHGIIGDPKGIDTDAVESILLDSRSGLLKGDRVKGILLHFDTPGGTVLDSDNIYRMLNEYKVRYKVPVFGFVNGLCASGGMYIASSADQVFAGPASVIGSVGVVMGPFFNVADTLGKLGIQSKTITEGLDKDMMNPMRPWKEGEDASIKAIMAYFYDQFVEIVTSARPQLSKEKLINEYGARIFDGVTAQKFGYVDIAMSSRNDALIALLHQAQIDPTKPYQVIELIPKNNWISDLFESKSPIFSGTIEHRLDIGQPKIKDQFAYLYTP